MNHPNPDELGKDIIFIGIVILFASAFLSLIIPDLFGITLNW